MKAKYIVAAAVMVIASACGSTVDDSESGSGSTTASTTAGEFDPNATFTWMYVLDTTSFDPDKITSNISNMYLYPIYDSLVHVDEQAKPQPMLAESWEIVDDGKALEMKLIEGWSFHDGEKFDAEAVKANIERKQTLPGSFNAPRLESVTAVEVVDEYTVRLVTDAPTPLVPILGTSAGMMMSPAAFDKPGEDVAPTGGSGAFRISNYVPGSVVEYTAVEDYWDPESLKLSKMVFRITGDDNARLNAVTTGTADAGFIRSPQRQAAEATEGVIVAEGSGLGVDSLILNTSRSEFDDQRVRQALSYAIDREALNTLLDGLCAPSAQIFPSFYWAASPNIGEDRYAHDAGKAQQLLADAGLSDGFAFDLYVYNLPEAIQTVEVIQQNFAEVGIQAEIMPVDRELLEEKFAVEKSLDAVFFDPKAEPDPSVTTGALFLESGFLNPGGWSDPEVTRLHNEGLLGSSPEERAPIYHEMMDIVTEAAAPVIPLCNPKTLIAQNDRVQGLEIYADASRQFRGVSMAVKDGG